jgi:hypothetical protein
MEYWSIEKIISGCEVFHKPSLYNISIRDQIVLPPLQHSITPILHKPFKFKETKSPLGITKAGSFGPGFLLPNVRVVSKESKGLTYQWRRSLRQALISYTIFLTDLKD